MKTVSQVPGIAFVPGPSMVLDLHRRWQLLAEKVAMQIPEAGRMKAFTYQDLLRLSSKLAWSIHKTQAKTVAILSESTPEWVLALFATFLSDSLLIVLDPQLSDQELGKQITDSSCDLVFTSKKNSARLNSLDYSGARLELETVVEGLRLQPEFLSIDWTQVDFHRTLLVVQGSGTTGGSKSIMISAANLLYETHAVCEKLQIYATDRVLSILPINHLFELTGGTLSPLYAGACVTFANTLMPQEIIQLMVQERITLMAGVPLFFKAMKRSIELKIEKASWLSRKIFAVISRLSPWLPEPLLRKILPVHKNLGGQLRYFLSGGAPLPLAVENFFKSIGLRLMQGYGLSEASPVVSANSLNGQKAGSCGQALPGTEIKIMNQDAQGIGELWVRGPQVMLGYWRNPAATAEVLTADGWLKTGDLGYIDADGYLFLTGRSRNLVALGAGKKVYPEEVEALLHDLSLVKEFCVTGSKREDWEEVTLVCVPQDEMWQSSGGNVNAIRTKIEAEVGRIMLHVADFKKPKRILLSANALPKTSSHKVKVKLVQDRISRGEFL